MKTLAEEIANGETAELEFKRDVPSEKLKLLKTAVAFANCNGGRIVVGVDDDRTVVRYMNIIEDWGSGIRRIQGLLADAGLKPLSAEASGLDLRITIWRKQANDGGLKTVQSEVSEKTEKLVLNEKKLVFDGENVVLGCGNSTVNSTQGGENSTVGFGNSTVINGYGSLSKSLRRLVDVLGSECLGSKELCVRLGLKSRGALAQTYIRPALKAGLIMVVGGKTHSAQRAYRLMDSAKVNQ